MKQEYNGMTGTEWQPVELTSWGQGSYYLEQDEQRSIQEKMAWIREYEGTGRFYYDGLFDQIYFERDEDRTMFLLRWGTPE